MSLGCLFGLHSPEQVRIVEIDPDKRILALRRLTRCVRCGIRISEEVVPVAELPASGDGAL